MKRPSFQFYPGDWRANAKLRRCSHALRGIWLEAMCLLHDSEEEYGVLRWPLKDLAVAIGCKVQELQALRDKGVLKGADVGERCAAFVYTPRHAGQDGEPVVLLAEQAGPVWYSSRMVKDEHVRTRRATGGAEGAPKGDTKGAHPSRAQARLPAQSSSSSSSEKPKSKALSGAALPDGVDKSESPERKALRAQAIEAIAYLNAKAGTKFRSTPADLQFAIDRMRQGATLEDLLAVVDAKVAEAAAGTFERKYLRPETLWNATKFGSYIGQVGAAAPAAAASTIVSVLGKGIVDTLETPLVSYTARGEVDPFEIAKNVVTRSWPIIRSKFPKGDCRTIVVAWGDQRRVFAMKELQEVAAA